MKVEKLFRRRYIPDEFLSLDDDKILYTDDECVITSWKAIHPCDKLSHGLSCYFLNEGIKLSKMYHSDGTLFRWYCDIVEYIYDEATHALTVNDLLADVIIMPDSTLKVVDLDELSDAYKDRLISEEQLHRSLNSLNKLLNIIYENKFSKLQDKLNIIETQK